MKNYKLIKEQCSIDYNSKVEFPPVAISKGFVDYQTINGSKRIELALGTYGNFSFVSAPPKTHKTYFVSLLASAYLGGTNQFVGDIKGHRNDECLIHFDTEQGKFHAQRVFRRVADMNTNADLGCYETYVLRTIGYKTRLEFIDEILKNKKHKIGVVIIDGIADLCSDVNNIVEANEVVQKLMEWSAKYNCHIITVIHSNWGSEKPTGHLGSFMEKKAETQIQLERHPNDKNVVHVKCKRTRGFPFKDFSFKINEFGLPDVVSEDYFNPFKNVDL